MRHRHTQTRDKRSLSSVCISRDRLHPKELVNILIQYSSATKQPCIIQRRCINWRRQPADPPYTNARNSSKDEDVTLLRSVTIPLVLLASFTASVTAQDKPTADEVARELSNPVGSLASLVFQGT